MQLNLTPLQTHRLRSALWDAGEVLREIKLKPLKGDALQDMKALEQAVQNIESVLIGK